MCAVCVFLSLLCPYSSGVSIAAVNESNQYWAPASTASKALSSGHSVFLKQTRAGVWCPRCGWTMSSGANVCHEVCDEAMVNGVDQH
uniref:Uncharacterized protein n=1 Tax=Anopheles albimanus TaxID=7167 RepID=A0A182FWL5_ANOAL